MTSIMVEVPFTINEDTGDVSLISIDFLKIAERLAKEKVVQCNSCRKYFIRERGNPKYCDGCRQKRRE